MIFGEIHGTNEAPRFVGNYVCNLFRQKTSVVLALEIPTEEQGSIDRYLDGNGDSQNRRELLSTKHWQATTPDGRSGGKPVSILAFDAWAQGKPRDRAQAENIRSSYLKSADASFVVLVGNWHAKRTKGTTEDPNYESLSQILSDLPQMNLNVDYSGGTFWTCSALRTCGEKQIRGVPALFPRSTGISLGPTLTSPGFDGEFFVGQLTASQPARHIGGAPMTR
ncbi:MAG: hypothetical protein ABL931_03525 [Usitatibacteraceae bacterium]